MKTTFNFTDLEKQFLKNYFSKGINLNLLSDNVMTLHELCAVILINENKFIQLDTLKGVLGSLTKKGLFECENYYGDNQKLIYPSSDFNWNQETFDNLMSSLN